MINSSDIKKMRESLEEFFQKMTIEARIEVKTRASKESLLPVEEKNLKNPEKNLGLDVVDLNIKIEDPQILIGENGQTLIELQKILRSFLNKKLGKFFYLNLDINDYKKKKIEYLKGLARDLADEVVLTKKEKILLPMSAYERRIIHMEMSGRADVITESEGKEPYRKVIIKPR